MKYLKYLLIFLVFTSYAYSIQETSSCPVILNYAQNQLANCGVLKNSKGFVYVDLDDEYIHKLISFIQNEGFQEPPYFDNSDLVGAHISVIDSKEMTQYGIKNIEEYGKKIYFALKECKTVQPPNWREIDQVYIIVVDAPELDIIRQKYGLPKRKHDFHITIGVKRKIAKSA